MSLMRAPQGTNFLLTPEEARALEGLVNEKLERQNMLLDPKLAQELKELRQKLIDEGALPPDIQLREYYETFSQKFRPKILASLDGEALLNTIHDHSNHDSLVYWLEFKNDEEFPALFGSIAGGSALKFGIYRRKETGEWMTGNPREQVVLSVEEAIEKAREHRDQLVRGAELVEDLPADATDEDYGKLQEDMNRLAPTVCDLAWGHKYFSLLYPEKLDDFHVTDFQKFYIPKLLLRPLVGEGRFIHASCYVALARELGFSLKHLTYTLFIKWGRPHNYWRILARYQKPYRDGWLDMRDDSCIGIGWAKGLSKNNLPFLRFILSVA